MDVDGSADVGVQGVAVGTPATEGLPHRSQRAESPHWAPASGSDGKPLFGRGMEVTHAWEPGLYDPIHTCPIRPVRLAAPLERVMPVLRDTA